MQRILFILFVLSSFANELELSLLLRVVVVAGIVATNSAKLDTKAAAFLVIIFCGLIPRIFGNESIQIIEVVKDLGRYCNPVLLIIIGNFFFETLSAQKIFRWLIFVSCISAFLHLFHFLLGLGDARVVTYGYFKFSGHVELLVLIFGRKLGMGKTLKTLLIFSLVAYMSRTLLVGLALCYLYPLLKGKINMRGIASISLLTGLVIIGIEELNPELWGKIERIPTEIFNKNFVIDREHMAEINAGWRGFEVWRASTSYFQDDSFLTKIFGFGFGAQIDLGFEQTLGDVEFTEIGKLHNSIAEILFKTGGLGLACFIWWCRLVWKGLRGLVEPQLLMLYYLVAATVVMGAFGTGELGVVLVFLFNAHRLFVSNAS